MREQNTTKDPKIKIYVSCHKESYVPRNELVYPIQVGTAFAEKEIPGILHDNTGDNISDTNKRFCELTSQYWAWKNDDADYYGFMHYRRYFSFNPVQLEEDGFGNVIMDYPSETNLEQLYYDSRFMSDFIKEYDVLTVTPTNLKEIGLTVYGHYKNFSPAHRIEDFDLAIKIISRDYPELRDALNHYVNSPFAYFCNMYIMKKEIFNQYNQWLFDILNKHSQERVYDNYSMEENRISAFLAERLWGIYYTYLKENKELKTAELQRTLFQQTENNITISPAFENNNVPIVFSADQNYLPYVATAIQSILENSSKEQNYDIVILNSGIDEPEMTKLQHSLNVPNFSVRFYDVSKIIKGINFFTSQHISKESYFRLLIPFIFNRFTKVIYLDSDLIVLHDVSLMKNIKMGANILCAVKDVDWIAAYKQYDPKRKLYAESILKLKQPFNYFNAGVLIINIDMFKQEFSYNTILDMFTSNDWLFHDQDILNVLCAGKVQYLDMSWNCLVDYKDPEYSRMDAAKVIPFQIYEDFQQAYKNPYIVHYAGCKKPWNYPDSDMAEYFWYYCRHTNYYEQALKNMFVKHCQEVNADKIKEVNSGVEKLDYSSTLINGMDTPIYVDGIMVKLINKFNKKYPIGSKKRDRLRKILKRFA